MCGIMGYLGPQPIVSTLMKGLRSIEYRGYDSAGITVYTKNGFQRIRSIGPLSHLEKKTQNISQSCSIGIGHTRWATHGSPNEENAHPQKSGKIHIVHNGVIENAVQLKEKWNLQCLSQTDTEVIAHIIQHFYSKNSNLLQSTQLALQELKGNFSFLALSEDWNNQLIGCKKGPPLIVGFGQDKEFFISSDLPSLLQWTQNVCILDNPELFYIQKGQCQFFSFNGKPIEKKIQTIKKTQEISKKGAYPHFMLKEIFDQPLSVRSTIQHFSKNKNQIKEILQKARKLHIVACGSSYYAGLYGKYVIENLVRIPVEVNLASEFQYCSPLIQKDDPVLFISQSGETADILSCLAKAREYKGLCLALCNTPHSSLDRMVDICWNITAGVETAVASTKTFTSTLTALLMMAQYAVSTENLDDLPQQIEHILSQNSIIQDLPKQFKKFKSFLFLGRGPHYPIALEGALKMKELAYLHAEGYPFGEMKHGPLALVDDDVLVIGLISQKTYFQKNLINLEEIKSRKGKIVTIGESFKELKTFLCIIFLCLPLPY